MMLEFSLAFLSWPLLLCLAALNAPGEGIPFILAAGLLWLWIYKRAGGFALAYLAAPCLFGLPAVLSVFFFDFALTIPQKNIFALGLGLFAILAAAKFGAARAMGYRGRTARKAVFFCCLLLWAVWGFVALEASVIDVCVNWGIGVGEKLERILAFFWLFPVVFADAMILDGLVKDRRGDNAVLALTMNAIAHGMALLYFFKM
jgi:hypothetical protein